jgi:protein-S-isoprenylcysteine O-methyltransferase Ste14
VLILANPGWISIGAGLAVALLGESIRFTGVAYAGRSTRRTKKAGASRLVTDGPFGYVRNPLYVGNFFLSLGVVIMTNAWMPWMILVQIILFSFQYHFIVQHEESFLAKEFSEYASFKKNVHPWIPRLKPWTFEGQVKTEPGWSKARKSERNTFQAIIVTVILIILRWQLF